MTVAEPVARPVAERTPRRPYRGPVRLLLAVGLVVGLLHALLYPPWSGGADEATHFARALEMAHGRIIPEERDGRVTSPMPASYRRDQNNVIVVLYTGGPFDQRGLSAIENSRPDWSDTVEIDTQPTMAAAPLAYAPSAIAMAIPDRLGWAGVWVMWAGRIGNLVVYLLVAWAAIRVATAFRWTLAIAALFPMNLGIAASITPDALTISAFLLVVAVWIRVWRPGEAAVPVDEERHEEAVRSQADALSALEGNLLTVDGPDRPDTDDPRLGAEELGAAPSADRQPASPGTAGPVERLGAWVRTPLGTGAMVLAAGLLLVATKPPYFVVLVAFPMLLLASWRDARLRMASAGAAVALLAGGLFTLLSSSGSYKAVTSTIGGDISYQPDVQQERLLSDPLGFLGRVASDWFSNLDNTVQRWVRHVGYVEITMPHLLSWVFVVAVVVAAMVLDRDDLVALRRWPRAVWAVLAAVMVIALYASSYIYFDDTVDGIRMGLQIPRYVSPFFAIAVMGWAPRFPILLADRAARARAPGSERRWLTAAAVTAVVIVELGLMVFAVQTWSINGWSVETG